MKILGAVSRGPDLPFSVEELELHGPRPDEVLVRLVASGVCHTDAVIKSMFPAEAGPVLLGHEGSGIVQEVGSDVTGIAAGDHVVLSFSSCGACGPCQAQSPAYCLSFSALNLPAIRPDGSAKITRSGAPVLASFFGQSSFATHVLVSPRNVIVVDPDLDLVTLAPLGCGIQTGAGAVLNLLKPHPDSTFVVFGAGGVGLSALMAAKSLGVATIVAVDPVESRRELATKLGADVVLDPTAGNVVEELLELTGGGATHALDTSGIPAVIAGAVKALGTRGALVVVGLGATDVTIDVQDLLAKGKSIRGCIEGDSDPQHFIPKLLDLYRHGQLPFDQIVTRYPFEQINEAVVDAASGRTVKPVLVY